MGQTTLTIRLTDDEKKMMEVVSFLCDMTMTEFIKYSCFPLARALLSDEAKRAENLTMEVERVGSLLRTRFEMQRDLEKFKITQVMDETGKVFVTKYRDKT